MIEVDGLTVRFRDRPAVEDISFSIEAGECLALVGESGSGKSVSARSLLGLAGRGSTVSARTLHIEGADAMAFGEREWRAIRGAHVGMVLQDAMVSFDPLRRVGAEIAEPLRLHQPSLGRDARSARVVELLQQVGVPEPEARAAQYVHELSGGLRQRALIASAIAASPKLLIADEPTTALDVIVQEQILDLLKGHTAAGGGLLLISHDLAVVSRVADRVAVLRDGRIVETGPTASVIGAPTHAYTRELIDAVPGRHAHRAGSVLGDPVLVATGLTKTYRPAGGRWRRALNDVSFRVHAGESVGVVGESGSGKSTLARVLLGLLPPDSGEVLLAGQPWSAEPERRRRHRRKSIQLIHQNPTAAFDPRYIVARIIGEALPRQGRRARTEELLSQVGLSAELMASRPHQLSGGQRQRVAIARALATRPDVLVCDEPVSALDVSVQAQVLDLLVDLQRSTGVALVFITHDLGVVRQISDRLVVMRDGQIVEEGPAEEVFASPAHPYTRRLLDAIPSLEGL
jgi:peptide/nickel transport system ATP-binding protein